MKKKTLREKIKAELQKEVKVKVKDKPKKAVNDVNDSK